MSEKLPAPREGLSGKAMRRVVMGSFAGALMEWYDFFILARQQDWYLHRCFIQTAILYRSYSRLCYLWRWF